MNYMYIYVYLYLYICVYSIYLFIHVGVCVCVCVKQTVLNKEGFGSLSLFFKEAEINNTSTELCHFTLQFSPILLL